MLNLITRLGQRGLTLCTQSGRALLFLYHTLWRKPQPLKSLPLVIQAIYNVGVLSFVIIVISGLFIGMVLGLQGYHTLAKFGAAQQLGQLVALSIVRELGPVVTALLFAGRAGSALTAEIGLMKTTEQIASMEMIGVDPFAYIIAPRFWAGFISVPVLATIFSMIAIYGGFLVGVDWLGVDGGAFWSNMQAGVNFREDVISGLIKSVVFGGVITWIAVLQGYQAIPTAEGVSRATTRTVVYASLAVLGLDFILTAFMIGGW